MTPKQGAVYVRSLLAVNPVVMAPMAGICDVPFRRIVRRMGCHLVYTEMLSDNALIYGNRQTSKMAYIPKDDHPVAVQIFGADPEPMAQAARIVEANGADIIDINMGCPTPKITRNGEGSALMLDPDRARMIIRAVRHAVAVPVTVKMRRGWDAKHENAVDIAAIAEEEGASAVAVHGRYREQFYTGRADWEIIRRVKSSVSIPVIGNGDVMGPEDALRMMDITGCDGVMIARGALGNPWIFRRCLAYLRGEPVPDEPSAAERLAMAIRHLDSLVEFTGDEPGSVREMRKHIAWYTKGLRGAARVRVSINKYTRRDEVARMLAEYATYLGADVTF